MKKAIILCLALSCAIAFDLMTDLSPVASLKLLDTKY